MKETTVPFTTHETIETELVDGEKIETVFDETEFVYVLSEEFAFIRERLRDDYQRNMLRRLPAARKRIAKRVKEYRNSN